jgi:hypothetical protein
MVTKEEAIVRFSALNATYYVPQGVMLSTVPYEISNKFIQNASNGFIWTERYSHYVSNVVNIRSISANIPLCGVNFEVGLDRPLVHEHRYEFEEYFGFGGHCEGYSTNRIVIRFPQEIDGSNGSIRSLLLFDDGSSKEDQVDIEFAKTAIRLMVIGGFVKYWSAIKEYEKWFIDVAKLNAEEVLDIRKTMPEYIFESMRPETKVSVE